MNALLPTWLLPFRLSPGTMLCFTSGPRHAMDELTFRTFGGSSRGSRHVSQSLVPALALVGDLSELGVSGGFAVGNSIGSLVANMPDGPAAPTLPTPTDVPVPEPFDVPVPEPMDVPPPDPHDVPPPHEEDPEIDPQPRPIP